MARYKEYDYSQGKFIPIHFDRQILGSKDLGSKLNNTLYKQ
jgi:hypothetical protein